MAQQSLAERRNHHRQDVIVPTRYWVDDEREAVACDVLDISAGGMCVELPSGGWVDPGSFATVELPIPGGLTHASTPVRVVGVTSGPVRRAHFRFLDTSPVFQGLVECATQTWVARSCQ